MATKEVKEVKVEESGLPAGYWDELVPFRAFKDAGKYKDDIVVGVNGKIWRIKRGIEVMIPRKVYQVLSNSMKQDGKTADMLTGLQEKYARERSAFE